MARQVIHTGGQANDGTGDTLRAAMMKVNANFAELYDRGAAYSRALLKAVEPGRAAVAGAAILAEDLDRPANASGPFLWFAGDASAFCALDPLEGVYVAPLADASGKSGAWVRQFDGPPDARFFGASGDGRTDDTRAIQALIDFCIRRGDPVARLAPGRFVTTDTIHIGYGDAFRSLVLEGSHASYGGKTAGSSLWPTRYDRPALNIQGGRKSGVRHLAVIGPMRAFVQALVFKDSPPRRFPPDLSDWIDTANAPDALSRNAPFAGITVDVYSGPAPAKALPGAPVQKGANPMGAYDRRLSSEILLHDIRVEGFAAGLVLGANSPLQGDFLSLHRAQFGYCGLAISINNHQARNSRIQEVTYIACHTFLDTGSFGEGTGQLGGAITDISGGQSYQFLNVPAAGHSGNVSFTNVYWEGQVRIGQWGKSMAFPHAIAFHDCTFNFGDYSGRGRSHGISPRALLECGSQASVAFRRCTFVGIEQIQTLVWGDSTHVTVESCLIAGAQSLQHGAGPAALQAAGYCGGVLINPKSTFPERNLSYEGASILRSAGAASRKAGSCAHVPAGGSRTPYHPGLTHFFDSSTGRRWDIRQVRASRTLLSPTGMMNALTQPEPGLLRFVYPLALQDGPQANDFALDAGDLLVHFGAGTIYRVDSIQSESAGVQVLCTQMNNYNAAASSVITPFVDIARASGPFRLIKTGIMLPAKVFFGDFQAGSPRVANVSAGGRRGADIADFLVPGDMLHASAAADAFHQDPVPPNCRIAAIAPGDPASITLTQPALLSGRYPLYPVAIA
jgi:hypothetical protein